MPGKSLRIKITKRLDRTFHTVVIIFLTSNGIKLPRMEV